MNNYMYDIFYQQDTENGKKTKLFSPTINQRSKSSINRRKPVYEELYELSQKQGKEVIEDVSEESTVKNLLTAGNTSRKADIR